MIIIGLIFGFAIRMFDIYTQVLGAIFSLISVYILISVMINLNSKNKWYAMRDCFFNGWSFNLFIKWRRLWI